MQASLHEGYSADLKHKQNTLLDTHVSQNLETPTNHYQILKSTDFSNILGEQLRNFETSVDIATSVEFRLWKLPLLYSSDRWKLADQTSDSFWDVGKTCFFEP